MACQSWKITQKLAKNEHFPNPIFGKFGPNFYKHGNIYDQVVLCFQDTILGKKRPLYSFVRHTKPNSHF